MLQNHCVVSLLIGRPFFIYFGQELDIKCQQCGFDKGDHALLQCKFLTIKRFNLASTFVFIYIYNLYYPLYIITFSIQT